jgi:hypothetical protein
MLNRWRKRREKETHGRRGQEGGRGREKDTGTWGDETGGEGGVGIEQKMLRTNLSEEVSVCRQASVEKAVKNIRKKNMGGK